MRRAGDSNGSALEVIHFRWKATADLTPQALGVTYWFDAPSDGEPCSVTIRFLGRRLGVKRKPSRRDAFSASETIDNVIPGSGPIAITTRVFDIAPGEWHVSATAVSDRRGRSPSALKNGKLTLPKGAASGTTVYAPVANIRAPGARLGAWPALVGLGVVVAITTQALLASRAGISVTRLLTVSLVASLAGLVGAKLYYLVEHHRESPPLLTAGMCIQGFVLGAIGALAIGGAIVAVPIGQLLDVTAPGLMFGMMIGRFGCFFGGCCVGRPTGSRWGLWSSDRRIGARRIPAQLLESAVAAVTGLLALFVVMSETQRPQGVVFIGAIAAYTFGRQMLFPLRDLPRNTARGRLVVTWLALSVLVIDVAIAVLA